MKILALSDIHSNSNSIHQISRELNETDIVVISGDITDFNGLSAVKNVIEAIREYNKNIFAVHGNCDNYEVEKYLKEEGISVNFKFREFEGVYFGGIGGTNKGTGGVIENNHFQDFCEMIPNGRPWVLVTHEPAWGTKVDEPCSGYHAGNMAVREIVEQYQPIIAQSGHIHEAYGTDMLIKTRLINPGPFKNGRYAMIKLNTNIFSSEVKMQSI